MNTTQIIILVGTVVVFWLVLTFNRFVSLRNRVKEAFADIDVQLKRRYDLIPNLVETVKGYAAHEKGVFEQVTRARASAMGAQGKQEKAQAENMLSNTIKSLFAVAENYPDLKASQNFLELQAQLEGTENRMMWLGEQLLGFGRITSPAEIKRRLDEITPTGIRAVARDFFRPDRMNLALVSPLKNPPGLGGLLQLRTEA